MKSGSLLAFMGVELSRNGTLGPSPFRGSGTGFIRSSSKNRVTFSVCGGQKMRSEGSNYQEMGSFFGSMGGDFVKMGCLIE